MLARLQVTLDRTDLTERLILSEPRSRQPCSIQGESFSTPFSRRSAEAVEASYNLVVGYSGSLKSQAALDLTLCLAHQTRLATGKPVTVQVVYVVEEPEVPVFTAITPTTPIGRRNRERTSVLAMPSPRKTVTQEANDRASQFEQADRILWQARCLAEEWRGSLKTHLRFGAIAEQLAQVAEAEAANLLILGCESCRLPLIHKMVRQNLPCTILGIPPLVDEEGSAL
jgi:nucleotide-binding universal stress UspA family protein